MLETIAIPSELRGPHAYLTATKKAASGLRPEADGRVVIGPREGIAHLRVSREQLRRALLVLHGIWQEAQRRGWKITAVTKSGYGHRAGVGVAVRGHSYTIEINELTDRVPLSAEELAAWARQEAERFRYSWEKEPTPPTHRQVANGKLRVTLPSRWGGTGCGVWGAWLSGVRSC